METALEDHARVGVIGGGPAGSLFAYFLLTFARRMDLDLEVDIYEPRDFSKPGPGGCNMCGGIVSESLLQALAVDGINLPPAIVQRGIDSYVLHSERDTVRIDTPLREKRIAAVHRGGGPRDISRTVWGGLDGYLLGLAGQLGARVIPARVGEVGWDEGRPQVRLKDGAQTYDLLVGATGVNSSGWDLWEKLGFEGRRPETAKAYITELALGEKMISENFGDSMHVFFLNMPRLDCAAIIPKGDYVTVCLLGDDIDKDLIDAFFQEPAVQRTFPVTWAVGEGACHCSPKINLKEAQRPFLDRVVLVGDCGATRLYKDGIGAAYRTAKAAARTAVFSGVTAADFEKQYLPTYRAIANDNRYGKFTFRVVHWIKALPPLRRGALRMAASEQTHAGGSRRMSLVLWDMFTGSAPYRAIFYRTLDPRFWVPFLWSSLLSVGPGRGEPRGGKGVEAAHGEGSAG